MAVHEGAAGLGGVLAEHGAGHGLEMDVAVDEPGQYRRAVRVEDAGIGRSGIPERDDRAVADVDGRTPRRRTGAVDQDSVDDGEGRGRVVAGVRGSRGRRGYRSQGP